MEIDDGIDYTERIEEIILSDHEWNDWEVDFIENISNLDEEYLTERQREKINDLWNKINQ